MKINIKREVSDELEVLSCPCCSSNDIYANSYQGGIYQNGKCFAWVGCNSCMHTVRVESYTDSKESLLRTAISRWNSQNKSYGKGTRNDEEIKKRDDLIKQLADALSEFADRQLHCKINGKSCGLCTESNSCPFYRNRLLIDKAKAIVK